jgi:hypothetical protein
MNGMKLSMDPVANDGEERNIYWWAFKIMIYHNESISYHKIFISINFFLKK